MYARTYRSPEHHQFVISLRNDKARTCRALKRVVGLSSVAVERERPINPDHEEDFIDPIPDHRRLADAAERDDPHFVGDAGRHGCLDGVAGDGLATLTMPTSPGDVLPGQLAEFVQAVNERRFLL